MVGRHGSDATTGDVAGHEPTARLAVLAEVVVDALVEQSDFSSVAVVQAEGTRWRVVAARDRGRVGVVVNDASTETDGDGWAARVASALAVDAGVPVILDAPVGAEASASEQGSAMVVPITLEDGVLVGVILALDDRPGIATPAADRLAHAFARLLGGLYEDLWALRELEEQAEDALRRTDRHQRLVMEVAHDFRAPLSVIAGMAELVDRYPGDDERARLAGRAIAGNAHRLAALVDGLLDAETRDLEAIDERVERIDLALLAAEIAADVRHLVSTREIVVDHDGHGHVVAPPTVLRRLLLNLAANAVRNTVAGSVRILTEEVPDGAALVVADTGRGMSASDVERLRTAYARGEDSTGFGLGLSIVQRLTRAVGGDLEVTSTPGEGTTVRVLIPHAAGHAAVETGASPRGW